MFQILERAWGEAGLPTGSPESSVLDVCWTLWVRPAKGRGEQSKDRVQGMPTCTSLEEEEGP